MPISPLPGRTTAQIPSASLLGIHCEGARTNSLLYSRDLTNAAWVKTNVTAAKTATGIDNAANSASTLTAGADNATILQTLTLASAARSSSAYVKARTLTVNTTELVTNGVFAADLSGWTLSTTGGTPVFSSGRCRIVSNGGYSGIAQSILTVGKFYTVSFNYELVSGSLKYSTGGTAEYIVTTQGSGTVSTTLLAGSTTSFYIARGQAGVPAEFYIDNVSVKECAVAITRNGGTSWTDITSEINSSTWTRVKIENTSVTNPSVGFLIATSGDAIDVDIAPDEAGAFISSPIVTTTAAVTRNADVLSYPTASNMLATAGAIRMQFTPTHAPSGTIVLAGTYVDSSNYTQLLHDGTNLVFRKRIAGTNYDATKAMAFIADTDYLIAATWGASGTQVCVDGVLGTAHANTTNAQIGSTYQIGADGNSGQQAVAYIAQHHIWQSALSDVELQQATTP